MTGIVIWYVKAMIIFFVESQERSREFYRTFLQKEPSVDVEGMTMFEIDNSFVLGLMPETGIAKILGESVPHPSRGNGIPRCELYLFVKNLERAIERLVQAGGRLVSNVVERDWGDRVAYGTDLDRHVIALAQKK